MSTVISLNESITLPSSRRTTRIRYTPSGTRRPASSRPFHQKRCLIERFVDPPSSRSSTSLRTSLPSESITEKRILARSVRSKPSRIRSRTPSRVGREALGLGGKAKHERELALQLLRDEEGGNRRQHQQGEDRPDQGPGHGAGNLKDRMCAMRVQIIDPSGDVAPYDHALASALAGRGAGVELVTSRFVHGPAADPQGYSVRHAYYRLATRLAPDAPRLRRALKLAEHVPDTLLARSREGAADVRHHQWFPLPRLDARLLGPARPRVLTLHNILRAEHLERRLLDRMDAVVVHTRRGAEELATRGGVAEERIRVIPHGAFEHLTRQPGELPLPPDLAAVEGPVVLCFGVVRPYKGVDVLLEAFRDVDGGAVGGGPPAGRVDGAPAPARAPRPGPVRVPLRERPRAAGVLPPGGPARAAPPAGRRLRRALRRPRLRQADGALGRGRVPGRGGAPRRGTSRAARGPRGPRRRHRASCWPIPAARAELGERARAAAAGPYSWDRIAGQTLDLYEELVRR